MKKPTACYGSTEVYCRLWHLLIALSWPVRCNTTDLSPRSVGSCCPGYGFVFASPCVVSALESCNYITKACYVTQQLFGSLQMPAQGRPVSIPPERRQYRHVHANARPPEHSYIFKTLF